MPLQFSSSYLESRAHLGKSPPLLEDLLKLKLPIMINLEIKSPSKKVINQISELICKYKLQDKIVWGTASGGKWAEYMHSTNGDVL